MRIYFENKTLLLFSIAKPQQYDSAETQIFPEDPYTNFNVVLLLAT